MSFVPENFQVPETFETDRLRLRKLTSKDVQKDYEAVMSSVDHLQGVFPESWPSADMTLEQDLEDLEWHQEEFQRRLSFAYTVVNLAESECLGCVYVFPPPNTLYDATVILWVRESEFKEGLDDYLFLVVKQWMNGVWPFQKLVYPGREIAWKDLGNINIKFSP